MRDVSIHHKLRRIIIVTGGAALLLACAALVVYELVGFRDAMTCELSSMANIIGANSTAALEFNDPEAEKEKLAALSADTRIVLLSGAGILPVWRALAGQLRWSPHSPSRFAVQCTNPLETTGIFQKTP